MLLGGDGVESAEQSDPSDATNRGNSAGVSTVVLTPHRSPVPWRELWDRRELQGFLVWRELKVRYKQTAIGALWALFQPLVAMAIFSVIFGRLVGVDSGGVSYPSFALCGLVMWIFYANALGQASNSLVDNEALLSKVYFPRLMLPVAPVLAGLVEMAIGTILVMLVVATERNPLSLRLLAIPLPVVMIVASAIGFGLVLSAMNVHFRDVKYAVPFMLQVWMFASPIVYSADTIPDAWRPVYALNPVSTAVSIFRWSVLGSPFPPVAAVVTSLIVTAGVLAGGVMIFNRAEGTFADVV
ncbi:MAG: ABC transporter permease [Actinomycetota bacterium]